MSNQCIELQFSAFMRSSGPGTRCVGGDDIYSASRDYEKIFRACHYTSREMFPIVSACWFQTSAGKRTPHRQQM